MPFTLIRIHSKGMSMNKREVLQLITLTHGWMLVLFIFMAWCGCAAFTLNVPLTIIYKDNVT